MRIIPTPLLDEHRLNLFVAHPLNYNSFWFLSFSVIWWVNPAGIPQRSNWIVIEGIHCLRSTSSTFGFGDGPGRSSASSVVLHGFPGRQLSIRVRSRSDSTRKYNCSTSNCIYPTIASIRRISQSRLWVLWFEMYSWGNVRPGPWSLWR